MTHRVLASLGALAVVIAMTAVPVSGQAQAASPSADARTPWGAPDLQGVWEYRTLTPLQRPPELAGKEKFTDAEAAEFEKTAVFEQEDRQDNQVPADIVGNYNHFWWERGTKLANNRTSLIVDPPNGLLPAYTPEAQQRAGSPEAKRLAAANRGDVPPQSWEDLEPGDRCIQHGKAGPPLNPSGYNSNIQLFQTQGYVAILNEQIHETRIIPLDGRPHVGPQVRQWMGDSRGHWEGDTLIVETTNFNGKHEQVGRPYWMLNSARLTLVERFTRVDAETLLYEYTVTDPTIWVSPWTAQFPMTKNPNRLYEYACHEGNYSMEVRLAGARAQDKAAAEAARKGSK